MDHLEDNIRRVLEATPEPELKMPAADKQRAVAALKADVPTEAVPVQPYQISPWRRFSPLLAMAAGFAIIVLATNNLMAFSWPWESAADAGAADDSASGLIVGGTLLTYIALALSSTGPLAARAFMPLAIICTLAAYPEKCFDLIHYRIDVPAALEFLVTDPALITMWVLAVCECLAEKNNELKEVLDEILKGAKAAAAVVIALMLVPEEAAQTVAMATTDIHQAGTSGYGLLALGCGAITWFLAAIRTRFFRWTREADADDSLWLRGFLSWIEDFTAISGLALIILLPALALLSIGLLMIGAAIVTWLFNRLERRGSYPCPVCANTCMPAALECPSCAAELTPRKVLLWRGGALNNAHGEPLVGDKRHQHRLRLLSQRKCPSCSEPLDVRHFLREGCAVCNEQFTGEKQNDWFDDYLREVLARAWRWLPLVFLVGLIPVVGFSFAVVVIKLALVSPLTVFLNFRQKFGLRWGMRVFTLIMLLPGCLPGVSAVAAPVLLAVHVWVYGRSARKHATELLEPTAA